MIVKAVLEAPAKALVWIARTGARQKLWLSATALVATLVLGCVYIVFGALRLDPTAATMRVRVHLAESGGLLPGQDVTVRGVSVGRVRAVRLSDDGVVAIAEIDAGARIPADSRVKVSALSVAGEQYLDFLPDADEGPYLSDDAEIAVERTEIPPSLPDLLGDFSGALAQLDPGRVETIVKELGVEPGGVRKLESLLDGGMFMISTLDSVLPQTVQLLETSKVTLGTLGEVAPGMRALSAHAAAVLGGVAAMDGGARQLLDQGPEALRALDDIIADSSPTMVRLLVNLATVAELHYARLPALEALFPDHRGSTIEAIGSTFRDGGTWGIVDLYMRYSCSYDLPRLAPSVPDYPEPYLYTYCPDPDPSVLVRGARNAPRPPGDDTAGPPPGADPHATAGPTPMTPYTIETPYGGPDLTPGG
ncbi:MAG TPA: MlaD family protein [Nocardia sp.]|uniref:MlaD family protein n=1 Tax=Nocardia TaxID=1817 RepID=UPI0024584EA9|nr:MULTISPECIES: MlaD family protein [Nocardia]HLS76738.1 MlaD family protein [Nocardia sp.]